MSDLSAGMREGMEFLELLQLQGSNRMVTKSELRAKVKERGVRVSERQLTTYISEGLVPKSARIGSRSGAFPEIVVDLVVFIARAREIGLPHQAILELKPVWRFLVEAVNRHNLDLAEFERVARDEVQSSEAAFAIPWLFHTALRSCPQCGVARRCEEDLKITYRDGSSEVLRPGPGEPPIVSFVMAECDDDGEPAQVSAWMRIVLPAPIEEDDRTRVILGVPNGVAVRGPWADGHARSTSDGEEADRSLA